MRARKVRCRDCGMEGIETDDDLMPDTCPACFEVRIARAFDAATEAAKEGGGVTHLFVAMLLEGCRPLPLARWLRDRLPPGSVQIVNAPVEGEC
jgi:hypothetical protein